MKTITITIDEYDRLKADVKQAEITIAPLVKCRGILEKILGAHDTDNNGAFMGEAQLCRYFAIAARDAILNAGGHVVTK